MASTSDLDATLQDKLMKVEDDLLDAAFDGPSATSAYIDRFSALTQSAAFGIANRLLSSRTIALIRRVASNVSSMANNLRELEPRTKAVETKREADLVDLFSRFSLKDDKPDAQIQPTIPLKASRKKHARTNQQPSISGAPLSRSSSEETLVEADDGQAKAPAFPAHIPLCYEWLLNNPHYPYPSHKVKERIASSSDTRLKTIDSWFGNIRRRIGWTALSKAHFRGVRALTVDYAQRVLKEGNQDGSVPHNIALDFLHMKADLDKAYESELGASRVVKDVEEMLRSDERLVRKLSPQVKGKGSAGTSASDSLDGSRNTSIGCTVPPDQSSTLPKIPSPGSSPILSNSPFSEVQSLHPTAATEQDTLKRPAKRRRSITDDARVAKRVCSSNSESSAGSALPPQVTNPLASPPSSRKRRFSLCESDRAPPAKRSRSSPQYAVNQAMNSDSASRTEDAVPTGKLTDSDGSLSTHLYLDVPKAGTVGRPIPHGDLAISSYNWLNNPMELGTSTVIAKPFNLDDFSRDFVEASSSVDPTTINLPKSHAGETSCDPDNTFNAVASGGQELTAEVEEDPFATLRPEDFGGDFAGFPAMPELNIDWTDISPPSLESFLLPSDLFLSAQMPINFPTTDGAELDYFSGSASTLVDSTAPPSSLLDKPSEQLDIVNSESLAVLALMRGAASTPEFVQEMPQTARLT